MKQKPCRHLARRRKGDQTCPSPKRQASRHWCQADWLPSYYPTNLRSQFRRSGNRFLNTKGKNCIRCCIIPSGKITDFLDNERNKTIINVKAALDTDDLADVGVVDVDDRSGTFLVEGGICRQLDRVSSLQFNFSRWPLESNFDHQSCRMVKFIGHTPSSRPVRISGPLVSRAMATGTVILSLSPKFLTAWRTDAMVFPWYSYEPCEKLRRAMFIPVSTIFSNISTLAEAGPAQYKSKLFGEKKWHSIHLSIIPMVQMIPDRRTRDALVLISKEQRWSMWVLAGTFDRVPSPAYVNVIKRLRANSQIRFGEQRNEWRVLRAILEAT